RPESLSPGPRATGRPGARRPRRQPSLNEALRVRLGSAIAAETSGWGKTEEYVAMRLRNSAILAAAVALALSAGASAQGQSPPRDLDCKLKFSLTSWSVIYKHVEGSGTVLCEGMPPMPVKISAHGGGLTVGK